MGVFLSKNIWGVIHGGGHFEDGDLFSSCQKYYQGNCSSAYLKMQIYWEIPRSVGEISQPMWANERVGAYFKKIL